jgi:hypothetical protein
MTTMKLPRTIRLDPSDTFVFERAAEAGEWAISGSFLFADSDPDMMSPKERTAFRSGFLGVRSLGFSTLAVVVEASEADRAAAVETLAAGFLSLGAPDAMQARRAAEDELTFAASLCDHPEGTLLALERTMQEGEIRERFRSLQARESLPGADKLHAMSRAFTFHEIEGEEPSVDERVDLVGLMQKEGK